MSRASVILRNVAANWAGFAVNALVTLALTPFVLKSLGAAGYGIWILSSSVVGYYGLLDVGFRAGVTQYLTRYLAVGDTVRASECMSAAIVALTGIGVVMLGLSVGAAYLVPHIFDLPAGLAHETFWTILIVGVSAAIQFTLQPFGSVFTAKQRFDLANFIGIGTRLLTAAGIVIALNSGWGLIGLSVVTCAVSVLDYLIRWGVAHRLAPELKIRLRQVNLSRLKEISTFGIWNFLTSINMYVYFHVPNMLIGLFMPVAAVGQYALAMGLIRQLNWAISPIAAVMYPAAATLDVQQDRAGLERLYHEGSRLLVLVMIPVVLIAGFWAEDFYQLWIGHTYLEGGSYHSVAMVFQVLLFGTVPGFSNIAAQILTGAGRVKLVATVVICGSAINLITCLTLIGPFGLAGVAMGTVVSSIVIDMTVMPLLAQKVLGLRLRDFVRRAWVRPLIAGMLQAGAIVGIRWLGTADSWLDLALQCLAAGCISVLIAGFVATTAEERHRFVRRPLQRLFGRAT